MQLENEFDRRVKNILANAAEKAPSDAWANIQARLSGAPAKPSRNWWWLLAPAFCALAAVIILNRPGSEISAPASVAGEVCATAEVSVPEETVQPVELLTRAEHKAIAMAEKKVLVSSPAAIVNENNCSEPAEKTEEVVTSKPSAETEQTETETEAKAETNIEKTVASAAPDKRISWNEFNRKESIPASTSGNGPKFRLDAKGVAGSNGNNFISQAGRDFYSYGVGSGASEIVETSQSSYNVPFSVVIGGRMYLLPQLSIGTGISYSMLSRKFTGTYETSVEQQIQHTMHYLGIPVDVQFDFLKLKILNLFVNAGGQADYCVANVYNIGGQRVTDSVSGIQFSVNAGVGVELKITRHFGFFVAPGVKYYFNCNQPKSIRTERPFNFQLDGGFRFTL